MGDTGHRPDAPITVFGRPAPGLSSPISPVDCAGGWMVATILFVVSLGVWVAIVGLPTDTAESTIPAVAIAHGEWRCAYPRNADSSSPPLYPVVAAGVMAGTGLGEEGFPPAPFGSDCGRSSRALSHWYSSSRDILLIGLLGWPLLLAGFIIVLRAAGRGRNRWESLGACLIACTPPLALALVQDFHPEDLFAITLILGAAAAAIRGRWLAAGVLIGLACCAKQYSLLAAVPLLLVAPRHAWSKFVAGAVIPVLFLLVPSGLLIGKGLVNAVVGSNATPAGTTTPVGWLGLGGAGRVIVSRIVPMGLAALLALWSRLRLESTACRSIPLVSLIATALALRLVFEVSLFGYYFMALSVALITVDMVVGRLRVVTIVWIAVVTALFSPAVERLAGVASRFPFPVDLAVTLSGTALAVLPLMASVRRSTGDHRSAPLVVGMDQERLPGTERLESPQ